jgi:hypothetical protein
MVFILYFSTRSLTTHKQGTIDVESIGVFYAPTTEESVTNGELTFGGADESKLSKSIVYTPLTTTEPATVSTDI